MNDLTGAFLYAFERGIDPNFIAQSFFSAGYSTQEVQEAMMEAQQIFSFRKRPTSMEKSSSKKRTFLFVLLFIFLILLGLATLYFFLGRNLEGFNSLLQKLNFGN